MLALYHNDMSLCAQKVRVGLAEKKLDWESRHLVLRAAEHQQPWYLELNRRAVVPTLIDGEKVIPELNVILEYLDEAYPDPALAPLDAYGRARMRLWTKQLDEDVHDASAAILSFGIAFRHQYLERGELGKTMLEQIPNVFKRERRRDVVEKGPQSRHFVIAVERMVLLLDEMEEALSAHQWLAGDDYSLADVAFTPYLARLEHLNILGMIGERHRVADWYRRCKARPSFHDAIVKWENADYLGLMQRRGTECWPQVQRDHAGAMSLPARRQPAKVKSSTKGYCMPSFYAKRRVFVLAALVLAGLARPAAAQTYPTQNITFQVAFAAGGIADVVARFVGQKLTERLGQTVVVENRGGAGGNLAAKSVIGAAPDGYTILATTTGLAVNETATKNKGFSVDDLRPVAIVAFSPDVLAIHPSNPAKDLREFIQNGKTKSFTYGSAGVGTGPHIGAEYFFREVAKVQAVHVPFTGGAPAVTSAIGNHVDAIVLTLPTVVPPITQGLLRGIGLASATRNSAVPNVPTYGEMGFPDVYSGSWVGFFVPAKTPDAVVAKLNAEINAIMREPEAQQKMKAIGFDVMIKPEAETADYFKREVATWGKMTRAIGYSSD